MALDGYAKRGHLPRSDLAHHNVALQQILEVPSSSCITKQQQCSLAKVSNIEKTRQSVAASPYCQSTNDGTRTKGPLESAEMPVHCRGTTLDGVSDSSEDVESVSTEASEDDRGADLEDFVDLSSDMNSFGLEMQLDEPHLYAPDASLAMQRFCTLQPAPDWQKQYRSLVKRCASTPPDDNGTDRCGKQPRLLPK
mmetsp:Transcript_71855/g.138845  ORF Transcript_71855/g.138845 Transcript_71855/m.138845 type:complete len:195 (+) Transcript_71855:3-587(+)